MNKTMTSKELEFTPFYAGRQQVATYDTVKDHIINLIQKHYQYGYDLAKVLVEEKDYDDKDDFCNKVGLTLPRQEQTTTTQQQEPTQFELIEYKEALRECND